MCKYHWLLILVILILSSITSIAAAGNTVKIEYFYSEGCPSCAETTPIINEIEQEYKDQVKIERLELSTSEDNWLRWEEYGFNEVPAIVIDDKIKIPYENITKEKIESTIDGILAGKTDNNTTESDNCIIPTPFGSLDACEFSLPVITIIIGLLDSFNPCSFFVLLFLLSLLVYVKSRRRMLLIGSIFIFFSGFVYLLFMLAVFGIFHGIFLITEQSSILSIVAGLFAVVLGGINIKDFFFFRNGPTLSIPENKKPKLFRRMRDIVKATYLPSMIIGTILLAIFANTYELFCTVILPVYFVNILTINNVPLMQSYLYIILYNVIYVIPLIIIVLISTIKLSKTKLSEWQGRILKLFSGLMMFLLGVTLLLMPELLNNVLSTMGLLVIALITAYVIVSITERYQKIDD